MAIRRPTAVPTREEVLSNPSLFDGLPLHSQDALYEEVAILEAKLRAKILVRRTSDKVVGPEPQDIVLIPEAAKMLATSEDTLHTKWQKLSFAYKDPLDGKIKFIRKGVARYIATRSGRDRVLT